MGDKQTRVMATDKNPVGKMVKQKKALIARLNNEITAIRKEAEERVAKVSSRIRVAQALVNALESGQLKP